MKFDKVLDYILDLFDTAYWAYDVILEFFFEEQITVLGVSYTTLDFVLGGAVTLFLTLAIANWTGKLVLPG